MAVAPNNYDVYGKRIAEEAPSETAVAYNRCNASGNRIAEAPSETAVAYNKYNASGKGIAEATPVAAAKRRRADFDDPSILSFSSFYARGDGRGETRVIVDTDPIGASYDFYLQCSKMSPHIGGTSAPSVDGGFKDHHVDLSVTGSNPARLSFMGSNPAQLSVMGANPARRKDSQSMTLQGGIPTNPVPSDASRTLFVLGLPSDCRRREVAHLFRCFEGYQELRLIRKEPKYHGGDPSVLCFVDFVSRAHAAVVKDALQGYKFDELDPLSVHLILQFARHPDARLAGGYR
ncbi:unnamed protein product [Coffea canephora]|uniref:RRM domain-containing protein n=1 Tax=Coffea canephora TaxID=49390 RepID=A0A068UA02_COFCA|nr:unnamed protein product [Coffea canephora]